MSLIPSPSHFPGQDYGATRRPACAGFTLLELLVVVAIIALLAAILLASLSNVREQTSRLTCQSNLRQLAFAWHQYFTDFKGDCFQKVNADITYGGRKGAVSIFRKSRPLNRYLNMPAKLTSGGEVFHCPGDRGDPSHFLHYGTSYRMNLCVVGQSRLFVRNSDPCRDTMEKVSDRLKHLNRAQMHDESRLLLMGDFEWVNHWQFNMPEGINWHGRRSYFNMAFLDGHAGFVRICKGIHTCSDYTVIPFKNLQLELCQCQEEVPLE